MTSGGTDCDLYVDANRNRIIELKDRVARVTEPPRATGAAPSAVVWGFPLAAETREHDAAKHEPRVVLVRRRGSSDSVSIATAGFVGGACELDGRRVSVRRVDGN